MQKSILVATIGTRDLAFKLSSGEWRNVGDKQTEDREMVQTEIGMIKTPLRDMTKYFLDSWNEYSDRLQPIIIGQLLQDKSKELEKIYLIGTDQLESVSFRSEDTLYVAQIIQLWIKKHLDVQVEVILQGHEGYNPSNFEEMFQWWKDTWKKITLEVGDDLFVLLSLKGGVSQSSEALRITALSLFAENVVFYDFSIDRERNLHGEASLYGNPFLGINYLWDRRQKEVLTLLKRFDYEAVDSILKAYYAENLNIEKFLEAAIYWNNSKFQEFANVLGERGTQRSQQWWWTGYESAYLAIIRYKQGNMVEACFHSFRSFEGILAYWAKQVFDNYITEENGTMYITRSIFDEEPRQKFFSQAEYNKEKPVCDLAKLEDRIKKFFEDKKNENKNYLLDFAALCKFFRKLRSEYKTECPSIKDLLTDKISGRRNKLVHQLTGVTKEDLLDFWGFNSVQDWENQIMEFLNFITQQKFSSWNEASLMAKVHREIENTIAKYQPLN